MRKTIAFVIGLMSLALFQFKNAFGVHFFQDDYWFLEISRITNLSGFIAFFSPFRSYSYKPLATEVFYLVIHWIDYNVFWAHTIMFVTFLVGVMYVYKIVLKLTNKTLLALLTSGLYLFHFTHVFQLYWFATFQEVAMMTFLAASLYSLLTKHTIRGLLLFALALLCKETAALFPIGLVLVALFDTKKRISWKIIGITFALSGVFYFIYRFSLNQVTSLENYSMSFNLRLIANNMVWYFLWGAGLPNLMPLYMPSLFKFPTADFWNLVAGIPALKTYLTFFGIYILLFVGSLFTLLFSDMKQRPSLIRYSIFCIAGFFIFLGPILFFPHRWMVRLTIPLIFLSLFQGYVIFRLLTRSLIFQIIAVILLLTYGLWNFYGTMFHESSSLYLPENDIYKRTESVLLQHAEQISKSGTIFFKDDERNRNYATQNSIRLKNSFHDQSFLTYFFPNSSLKAVYNFETDQIPTNAFIINSHDLVQ